MPLSIFQYSIPEIFCNLSFLPKFTKNLQKNIEIFHCVWWEGKGSIFFIMMTKIWDRVDIFIYQHVTSDKNSSHILN